MEVAWRLLYTQGRHSGHLCSVGGAAGEKLEPYSVAIRPEGQILVDFSALRAGFSTHIQWREGDSYYRPAQHPYSVECLPCVYRFSAFGWCVVGVCFPRD